jgi:hypothetical protein
MHLRWRDGVATVSVLIAVALYGLWLGDVGAFGEWSVRAVGALIFAFGLAASVVAVVFGVGAGLLRANAVYLVLAALIGLAALAAGIIALVAGSESMLGVLVGSTVVLWVMSTIRHAVTVETRDHEEIELTDLRRAA